MDFGHISDLSRVCELWDMTSVVKVDLNLPGVIYRTFDLGAQGIIVPHVALKTPALWWTPPNTAPLGIAARLEVVRMTPPPERPAGRIVGEGVEAVPELIRALQEEAKVI